MNFNRFSYKKVLYLGLALGSLSIFPVYRLFIAPNTPSKQSILEVLPAGNMHQNVQEILQKGSSVQDTLKAQLDIQHEAIVAEIKKAFPCTPEAWGQAYEEFERLKTQDNFIVANPRLKKNPNDLPIVLKVKELLVHNNIDPERMTILTINEPNNACDAAAGQCVNNNKVQHFIRLNLAQLLQHDACVQEALLTHEIMHLINYDSLEFACIEKLFKDFTIEPKMYNNAPCFIDLNKFIEYRADLMASAQGIGIATALQQAMTEHMAEFADDIISTNHPSCKQRYEAIANLAEYMKAENQMKIA